MLVFCTFALLATLYQFRMRSYLHYGILTMAPLSIIVGLSCSYAVNAAHVTRTRLYLCYSLLSTIALICLGGINSLKCYAWSPLQTYLTHHCHPKGITAAERSDVTELCTQLKTGEDLLVFPTLNNYVHFYCETVPRSSPVRYTWDPSPPYTAILENAATNRVVIHHSIHQTHPQPGCKHYGCPELLSSIESKGFIPVLNLPTLTLYDRSAKE